MEITAINNLDSGVPVAYKLKLEVWVITINLNKPGITRAVNMYFG